MVFSGHADQAELLAWQKLTSAKRTFLVHGEEDIMRQFAANLADTRVEIPGPNQVFELLAGALIMLVPSPHFAWAKKLA